VDTIEDYKKEGSFLKKRTKKTFMTLMRGGTGLSASNE
jgi:hypothetical protein